MWGSRSLAQAESAVTAGSRVYHRAREMRVVYLQERGTLDDLAFRGQAQAGGPALKVVVVARHFQACRFWVLEMVA